MEHSYRQPPYPLHESVIGRLHPQYRDFYNKHIYDKPAVHHQPVAASRANGVLIPGAGPSLPVASTRDLSIPRKESDGQDVPIRVFTPLGQVPSSGWPLCFWLHGGGWVLGNIDTENVIATSLCNRAKTMVICVDYRLAPEHIFPAAVHDCWEALLWAASTIGIQTLHVNPSLLAIGGSSAGGNLTAVLCQRALSRSDIPSISLQLLSVPVTDNRATPTSSDPDHISWRLNEFSPALPAEKMMWYRRHYLPDSATWTHPEATPILWEGDWSGLPPAVIVVGEIDVLCSEGQAFGRRLESAGTKVKMHVVRGMPHPFIAMDGVLDDGKRAITLFCDALSIAFYGKKTTLASFESDGDI